MEQPQNNHRFGLDAVGDHERGAADRQFARARDAARPPAAGIVRQAPDGGFDRVTDTDGGRDGRGDGGMPTRIG
jgi:hypothetical protein